MNNNVVDITALLIIVPPLQRPELGAPVSGDITYCNTNPCPHGLFIHLFYTGEAILPYIYLFIKIETIGFLVLSSHRIFNWSFVLNIHDPVTWYTVYILGWLKADFCRIV